MISGATSTTGHTMRSFSFLFLAGLMVGLLPVAGCSQVLEKSGTSGYPVKIAGCYSDMYYNEEGGDLLGYEFFIVPARNTYYVFYQESDGEPYIPLVLPVVVTGNTIHFFVPRHDSMQEFHGEISEKGLTGKFLDADVHIFLERKPSYWQ